MFGLLDRYIGRAILTTTLLVLLTLVALASVFGFVGELDDVGKGRYTVTRAAQYVLLTVPGKAYLLFAPAVLLGSLLGLGALASNSELTVMRAAGVSNGRIVRSVLVTGLALMLFVAVIGETVMPKAEQLAEEIRLTALEKRLSVKGGNGLWVRSAGRYVNIATVMPDFTLLDVSVHDFDGNRLVSALQASRAVRDAKGEWQLEDIRMSRIGAEGVTIERLESMAWRELVRRAEMTPDGMTGQSSEPEPSSGASAGRASAGKVPALVSADVLKSLSISPENLSASDLSEQIRYLRDNGLDSRRIELAFWVKLTSPLATLVMLMLSLPFVFTSQRSGGAGQKIFIGIMLGIVYVLLNRLLTQLALANGVTPLLSAIMPLVLFLGIAVIGIRRSA